ncbi:hypothetical protein [Streptomyces atratus]|uniref:hypothetical protein n=1 Tax=Streptomyces atratus TaxID=1893 RepID=UPI00225057DE|nr:hypothetical protein [Streptomyces atratus]MCX5341647.1 hypothetical protein [Streptomyces atratus]
MADDGQVQKHPAGHVCRLHSVARTLERRAVEVKGGGGPDEFVGAMLDFGNEDRWGGVSPPTT